jgi:hypothetical protein
MGAVARQSTCVTANDLIDAMCCDMSSLLVMAAVVACTAQGAQVGGVERTGGCEGEGLDMVDTCIAFTTDVSLAPHAPKAITHEDILTQPTPDSTIVEAWHSAQTGDEQEQG